ncbi:hypothetical protein EST38_g12705 [Candolleomyces aberdarensis]|uniref:DUF6534 domain-containing protein n=1 Tax=Candolleomyces aberdarensis TaxID=2316362 RepID=A0A4Q2D2W9_9AGAR|nr:hypothetical protein EST38_g12705 [Candolleomyces aberdarensis]
MDTVHKCLIMAGNYKDIVSGKAMNPTGPNRLMIVTQAFTSFVAVPVQVFFMYRIWRCKRQPLHSLSTSIHRIVCNKVANRVRWFFIVPLAPCILFHFVMGFVLTTVNWIRHDNLNAIPRSTMLALIVADMTVTAAVDVLLAVGLCAVLWRTYLEVVSGIAGVKSGIAIVQRIVLLTINTGIWTALFAILTMATSIRYPDNLIHVAICLIISPVYVNMLLANLNARTPICEGTNEALEFDKSEVSSGRISSIRIRSVGFDCRSDLFRGLAF